MLRGQFTYTACQAEGPYDRAPGWKVKQAESVDPARPLPPDAVQAAVRSFGAFQTPIVPDLATLAEIADLPKCLRLDAPSGQYRSVAHLAAAGRDHTNREAFFAHGLLIELTDDRPPLDPQDVGAGSWGIPRPADLWGSVNWLTPFRAQAIESATIAALPQVSLASPLDPERQEDFIDLHPGQREFVFAAFERAVTQGSALVIVGLAVEVAMWTSLVTHLMVPSAGWSVRFSTFERAALPHAVLEGPLQIIGVPIEDAPGWRAVPGDRVALLIPGSPPVPTLDGYRLHDGSVLAIGAWAQLAEGLCRAGQEQAARRAVDAIGTRLVGSTGQRPLFGLAAAVLLDQEMTDRLPDLARLACRVATEHFPADGVDQHTSGLLVDAMLRVSADPLVVFGGLLRALDQQSGRTSPIADHIVRGYLLAVLNTPQQFAGDDLPWLPAHLQVSAMVSQQLMSDLERSIAWVDDEPDPAVRGRVVLYAAIVAESMGWAEGRSQPAVFAALGQRARSSLIPLLIAGRPLLGSRGWPRLPRWLWYDVLVEALIESLPGRVPGALLAAPGLLQLIDDAAGPLPTAIVPGVTLAALNGLDGERAAAMLRPVPAPSGIRPNQTMTAAQAELLAAAAFIRAVFGDPSNPVPSDRLTGLARAWFGAVPVRDEVLLDLIVELEQRSPRADLQSFANDMLSRCPPSAITATIVEKVNGGRPCPRGTILEMHRQFAQTCPRTPRLRPGSQYPLNPDLIETGLLDAVVAAKLPGELLTPGHKRLARWILIRPAAALDLAPRRWDRNVPGWLAMSKSPELSKHLKEVYPTVAAELVTEWAREQSSTKDADELCIEWVVRAAMTALQVPGDPAEPFFAGGTGKGSDWADGVRAMIRTETRSREELQTWVLNVQDAALEVGKLAGLMPSGDNWLRQFTDEASDIAARVVEIAGLKRLLKWSPTRR